MALDVHTLDTLGARGKTVLLRLDINSPIEDGRVAATARIEASVATLKELARADAKVVVLAHQGRKGDDDYTSLEEHARILGEKSGVPTRFVKDLAGSEAKDAVKSLAAGTALVLENVRSIEAETGKKSATEHAKAPHVAALSAHADAYVNDAFSASHRSQASLVGFPQLLPSAAGRLLERELDALQKACDAPERPAVYFLGGAKVDDSLMVMRHNLGRGVLDIALLGGLVGELFLVARGHKLGAPTMGILERKGVLKHLKEAEALLAEHDDAIVTPEDVGVKTASGRKDLYIEQLPAEEVILDIGPDTMATYREAIGDAGSLFFNGPAGAIEEEGFDQGTRAVLKAFAESEAFSLMGGGHTVGAIDKFGLKRDAFGYVSLAGGALMAYVSGEKLPAIEALREAKKRWPGGTSA